MILPNPQVIVSFDHAIKRVQLANHQLEQCGFPTAIWPHEGNTAVQVNAKVNIAVEHLGGEGDGVSNKRNCNEWCTNHMICIM